METNGVMVSIEVDGSGRGKFVLNGLDLSESVHGFDIIARTREATKITIYAYAHNVQVIGDKLKGAEVIEVPT